MRGSIVGGWAIALLTSASLAACTDPGPSGQALWAQACTLPTSSEELPADQRATALAWQFGCRERYAAIAAESKPAADALARCVLQERESLPSKDAVLECVGEPHRALIQRVAERYDAENPSLADQYRDLMKEEAAASERSAAEGRQDAERGD